jgi:imidazolonepropionase-like amidohydrolase
MRSQRKSPWRAFAIVTLLGIVGAAAPARSASAAPEPLERTFLVGAEVHVGNGKVIEGGVVEIVGDEIASVRGPESRASLPADAKIIDLEGRWLTPGLIAADTSLGLVEIGMEKSTRDDGRHDEQAIRAGFDPAPAVNADSSLIQVQALEGLTSAAVAPAGGLLSGQVAWIDLLAGDHAGIVAAAGVAVDGGLGQHQGSRAASFATLRRAFEDARFLRRSKGAHDRGQSRELIAHPLDLEALYPILDGKIPLTINADRASDLLGLIALAEEFDIDLTIVGATEGWKVAQELAAADVTVVIQPSGNLPGNFDRLGARLDNAARLSKAGVRVAISDFGDSHNVRNISQEAGIAVSYGMEYEAALSAVTQNVAHAYGMEDRYGTIEKGKVANLVVWGGDPFELDNWAESVFIRGRTIPMESRQTKLRDRYLDLSKYEK